MNEIVKVVQQIGNGGHVYLPKGMVGKKVVVNAVEKSIEDIRGEIIEMLHKELEHIKGIYLYGSYTRGEQTAESDIDVLVITDGEVKIKQKINEYDIVSATIAEIQKTLKNNAVLLLPIIKESAALLNQQLIEEYKHEKLTKKNTKWYIETTESSLKLAGMMINDWDKESAANVVYPLMMRLRGLYLIKSLINGKPYTNKQLLDSLVNVNLTDSKAKQIYKMYREYRDSKKISSSTIDYDDIAKLYELTKKELKKAEALWDKLK